MSRNEYLTTGEVARMMGTTKNTLFHYDQLGIFSPEARGDNDYRYYTVRQMDVLDAIITLRELGMPLPEIKEYMEHRSPENYATLLTKENAVIEQQIRALKEKQKWIQRQQKRIENSLTTNPDIIEEITLPRFYIAAHPISSSDDKTISVKVSELLKARKLPVLQCFISRWNVTLPGVPTIFITRYALPCRPLPRKCLTGFFRLLNVSPPITWETGMIFHLPMTGCAAT